MIAVVSQQRTDSRGNAGGGNSMRQMRVIKPGDVVVTDEVLGVWSIVVIN
jgi:hypothetical protein